MEGKALERAVANWIQEPLLVEGIEEWNTKCDGKTRRRSHIKKRGLHLDPLIFLVSVKSLSVAY